jgi:hypothetical protein
VNTHTLGPYFSRERLGRLPRTLVLLSGASGHPKQTNFTSTPKTQFIPQTLIAPRHRTVPSRNQQGEFLKCLQSLFALLLGPVKRDAKLSAFREELTNLPGSHAEQSNHCLFVTERGRGSTLPKQPEVRIQQVAEIQKGERRCWSISRSWSNHSIEDTMQLHVFLNVLREGYTRMSSSTSSALRWPSVINYETTTRTPPLNSKGPNSKQKSR